MNELYLSTVLTFVLLRSSRGGKLSILGKVVLSVKEQSCLLFEVPCLFLTTNNESVGFTLLWFLEILLICRFDWPMVANDSKSV